MTGIGVGATAAAAAARDGVNDNGERDGIKNPPPSAGVSGTIGAEAPPTDCGTTTRIWADDDEAMRRESAAAMYRFISRVY